MKKLVLAIFVLLPLAPAATGKSRLPIINDNYDKALAEAKQRNLPLFVDVWAPW